MATRILMAPRVMRTTTAMAATAHPPPDRLTRAFAIGILLNIAFSVISVIAGFAAHSTALLADAAHNFGDVLGLCLAWGATVLARRARTARRTYGLGAAHRIAGVLGRRAAGVARGGTCTAGSQAYVGCA